MRILELFVKNFRNFEEETFEFNPNFTVVIGDNGLGKSSVLAALRVAFSTYMLGIDISKIHILKKDVRLKNVGDKQEDQLPVVVQVNKWEWLGEKQETIFRRELQTFSGKTTSNAAHVNAAKQKGIEVSELLKTGNVDLPIIALFGTGRLHGAGQNRDKSNIQLGRRVVQYGYENWFDMKATSYKYSSWLKGLDETKSETKLHLIAFREAIINAIPGINPDFRIRINELLFKVKHTYNISKSNENLRFEDSNHINTNALELPLSLLSDGYQVMIEMVAELAYKCIMLNGHKGKNAIKETYGIVLIDEIDMHLHPNWQKRVVSDLSKAFPKIQFIATTHSPFIVQSLKSDQLLNLNKNIPEPDVEPFQSSLEDVAENEMDVEQPNRSEKFLEMEKAASEYFRLIDIDADQHDIDQVKERLDELELLFSDNPVYVAFMKNKRIAKGYETSQEI